jgi:hypothetical protein
VSDGSQATTTVGVVQTGSAATISTPLNGTVSIEWWNGTPFGISPTTNIGGAPIASAAVVQEGPVNMGIADATLTMTLNVSDAIAAGGWYTPFPDVVPRHNNGHSVAEYVGQGFPSTWGRSPRQLALSLPRRPSWRSSRIPATALRVPPSNRR